MRFLVVFVFVVFALVSCENEQRTRLEQVKQEVCACQDVACAEAAMKRVPTDHVHPDHREQGVARDMLDCLARLYDAAKPVLPE